MTPTVRVRAALDQLINYAQDSNGNQYGSLCASLVEHIAQQALSELDGKVLVPVEPTAAMGIAWNRAASDSDSYFSTAYYKAMIAPYVEGEKE